MEGAAVGKRTIGQSGEVAVGKLATSAASQVAASEVDQVNWAANACSDAGASTSRDRQSSKTKSLGIDRVLVELPVGKDVWIHEVQPCGALMARRWKSGAVLFFWRATHKGELFRIEVGLYSETANKTWKVPAEDGRFSLSAARARASEIAVQHVNALPIGGYRNWIEESQRASQTTAAVEDSGSGRTLAALVELYWEQLGKLGLKSARETEKALRLHVLSNSLSLQAANQVSDEDIVTILRPIYSSKKGRQANKIRSYLGAAYTMAIKARLDANLPAELKAFEVRTNPVTATPANAQYNRADKNPLNTAEIRTYWRLIEKLDGLRGHALRLHLLCGSPRIEQLVEARRADLIEGALVLWDGKGRPGSEKRRHVLPLVGLALRELDALEKAGDFLFSSDGGKTHLANTTLSGWAQEAVGDSIPGFQLKRVRSGVETLLSSQSVSPQDRGRLQSHGIGGVQQIHYDAYDGFWEKFDALVVLHDALTSETAPEPRRARKAPSAAAPSSVRQPLAEREFPCEPPRTDQTAPTAVPRPFLRLVVSNGDR